MSYNLPKELIPIMAIKCNDEIIPIWDKRVSMIPGDEYDSAEFTVDGSKWNHPQMIPAVFNVITKQLSLGIVLNIKEKDREGFVVGKHYIHESKSPGKYNHWRLAKLISIEYKTFSESSLTGSELLSDYKNHEFEEKVNFEHVLPEHVFTIRSWKPTYTFDDGYETEWSMYIKYLDDFEEGPGK